MGIRWLTCGDRLLASPCELGDTDNRQWLLGDGGKLMCCGLVVVPMGECCGEHWGLKKVEDMIEFGLEASMQWLFIRQGIGCVGHDPCFSDTLIAWVFIVICLDAKGQLETFSCLIGTPKKC